jgi:hypothetical protein
MGSYNVYVYIVYFPLLKPRDGDSASLEFCRCLIFIVIQNFNSGNFIFQKNRRGLV